MQNMSHSEGKSRLRCREFEHLVHEVQYKFSVPLFNMDNGMRPSSEGLLFIGDCSNQDELSLIVPKCCRMFLFAPEQYLMRTANPFKNAQVYA